MKTLERQRFNKNTQKYTTITRHFLTRKEYGEYLFSEHWKDVKSRFWQSRMPKSCFVCGSHEQLQLHHKTYKRLFRERLTDLVLLCDTCHSGVHIYLKIHYGGGQKLNIWTAIKFYRRDYKHSRDKVKFRQLLTQIASRRI